MCSVCGSVFSEPTVEESEDHVAYCPLCRATDIAKIGDEVDIP
jgi:rubredoxin